MSIAYQSWEIGSGPTVGYKVHTHQHPGDGLTFRKLLYRPEATAKFMQQPQTCPPKQRLPTKLDESSSSPSSTPSLIKVEACLTPVLEAELPGNETSAAAAAAATSAPCYSSSSSLVVTSSISSDSSDEADDKEVQSAFKGPLEQMDTLMTTLPIRRGLSKFYVGRSRSFTSLADVKSMSIKDLAKPENPYAKRKRLPVHREGTETSKPRFPPPRISNGISKKPLSSNGATLTLAVAMSTKGDGLHSDECLATAKRLQKSCRSFSLTDLQKA